MALFSVGINALSSRGINTGTSGAALAGGVHADAIEDRTPVSQRDLGRDPPHTTCASTQHQPAPHHSDGAVSGTMPCDCWRSLARSLTLDRTKDAAQGLKYSVWVHGPENADSDDAGESVEALASESTGYVPDQTSRLGNLEQRTAHALEGVTPHPRVHFVDSRPPSPTLAPSPVSTFDNFSAPTDFRHNKTRRARPR